MFALRTAPSSVRLTTAAPADLVRTTELAPGVTVEIDLANPSRWHAIHIRHWDEADPALLGALLGRDAVRQLETAVGRDAAWQLGSAVGRDAAPAVLGANAVQVLGSDAAAAVPVQVASAPAWRRLAVIDALDWWLQLPLNQGLLDAERAIARARAATTLPFGPLRRTLTDRALVQARRSADDVTAYLGGVTSLPRALFSGLSRLVSGYVALAQEVDGPDSALSAVPQAWERLKAPVVDTVRLAGASMVSLSKVDPRQLRARIVGDVRMTASGGTSVRVVVPAYVPMPSRVVADRLMVRLVDRRSGEAQEPVLLTLRPDGIFTEELPLRGARLEHVRAEVFDADSELAPSDDLVRVRRAQLVLSEWRRAVAESRLTRDTRTRTRRLTRLSAALAPIAGPLFHGGPTQADLRHGTWPNSTPPAATPLTTELAAAHTTP